MLRVCVCERVREIQTDRQTETERQRKTETDRTRTLKLYFTRIVV